MGDGAALKPGGTRLSQLAALAARSSWQCGAGAGGGGGLFRSRFRYFLLVNPL
ncbi:hypothetical protein HNQ10_000059 [Deinococcus metallilatus]|uniref:Uncharacterized protein n=1 Tax=Deinococcus metallilatus TaxID=1211322 RepID=A0ABR6MPS4_9DEIO|nr:hypothetical protein [Deinococcus metallilatus]